MFVTAAVMRGQSFPLAAVFSSRELRNINNLVVTGDKVEGRLLEKHMAQMAQFVFFFPPTFFMEPDAVRVESGKLAVHGIHQKKISASWWTAGISWSEVGQDSHQGYLIEAMVDVGHVKKMPWNCHGPRLRYRGQDQTFRGYRRNLKKP